MIEYNEKKAVQTEEPDIKPHKLFRRYRPKYLKKPEKRKSLRALTCFALVFAALMASVAGTYAKYISDPVTIPSFSVEAAKFAPNVTFLSQDEINNNKSDYDLANTDVVVGAFNVSNNSNGKQSEVDLSVDVDLRLKAENAYTYHLKTDFDMSTLQQTTVFSDKYNNSEQDVLNNMSYCNNLKNRDKHLKLIIGETDTSGKFAKIKEIYGSPSSVSPSSLPPSFALSDSILDSDFSLSLDYGQLWEDAFTISAGGEHKYTALVVVDTLVKNEKGENVTFKAPDIELVSSLAKGNNLTVTVNQAKSKG